MSVRVRFAPSPTGYLHIGGARTALFNWLFARHHGGTFVLRIEDTDDARNSQEAVQVIFDTLKWLGIDWDEGPESACSTQGSRGDRGPYFQSARGEIYRRYVDRLLESGHAYEDGGAVKFRMDRSSVIIHDRVIGDVERKLTDREEKDPDFVIVRSDGKPVFHLVNVVDDIEMGITHVIRGEDHLSNTSKHIRLFAALGVKPPEFGHIPLILNANGSKMSKRDEGASMTSYMNAGFYPQAVVNFLSLLGWSTKSNQEIISLDELIEKFDISGILRSNSRFDMAKLLWMNGEYIKTMPIDDLVDGCIPFIKNQEPGIENYPRDYISLALESCREKIGTFSGMPEFCLFFFKSRIQFDPEIVGGQLNKQSRPVIAAVRDALVSAKSLDEDLVEQVVRQVAESLGIKPGKVMGPMRLAVTGSKAGPAVTKIIDIMGKNQVVQNLDDALAFIDEQAAGNQ